MNDSGNTCLLLATLVLLLVTAAGKKAYEECQDLSKSCEPGSQKSFKFCCRSDEVDKIRNTSNSKIQNPRKCGLVSGGNTCCRRVRRSPFDFPDDIIDKSPCTDAAGKKPCCEESGAKCGPFKHRTKLCCLAGGSTEKCVHEYEDTGEYTRCCDDATCNKDNRCVPCLTAGEACGSGDDKDKKNGGCCRYFQCRGSGGNKKTCKKCIPNGQECRSNESGACCSGKCTQSTRSEDPPNTCVRKI